MKVGNIKPDESIKNARIKEVYSGYVVGIFA